MLPLVYSPRYVTPLPDGHRFPMPKCGVLCDLLIERGVASAEQFHEQGNVSQASARHEVHARSPAMRSIAARADPIAL